MCWGIVKKMFRLPFTLPRVTFRKSVSSRLWSVGIKHLLNAGIEVFFYIEIFYWFKVIITSEQWRCGSICREASEQRNSCKMPRVERIHLGLFLGWAYTFQKRIKCFLHTVVKFTSPPKPNQTKKELKTNTWWWSLIKTKN